MEVEAADGMVKRGNARGGGGRKDDIYHSVYGWPMVKYTVGRA